MACRLHAGSSVPSEDRPIEPYALALKRVSVACLLLEDALTLLAATDSEQRTAVAAAYQNVRSIFSRGVASPDEAKLGQRVRMLFGPGHEVQSPPHPECVVRAVEYITKHLHEDVSLGVVAAAVGRQKQHLATTFRHSVGVAMREFVADQRVHRALSLIIQGEKVEAAALATGYRSARTFYRHVRSILGGLPSARHSTKLINISDARFSSGDTRIPFTELTQHALIRRATRRRRQ